MTKFVNALLYRPESVYMYCSKMYSHEINQAGKFQTLTPRGGQGLKRNQDSDNVIFYLYLISVFEISVLGMKREQHCKQHNKQTKQNNNKQQALKSLENGSVQLIVTLCSLTIYSSLHKQPIRAIFDGHIVSNNTKKNLKSTMVSRHRL